VADFPRRCAPSWGSSPHEVRLSANNLALETALEFPGVTRPLLDTCRPAVLLRIEDRLGLQRVELTHDVLAEVVPQRPRCPACTPGPRRGPRKRATRPRGRRPQTRRQRFAIAGLVLAVLALA